jgi:phenylacetate-CoA ligase
VSRMIRSAVAKNIAIPLKAAIKREPTRRVFRELDESQWFGEAELHDLRTRRLRHLLLGIGKHVPFYREQLRQLGADPETDDPWKILRALPTIDKKAYRSLGADLRGEQARRKPVIGHSSGTTGERLEVHIDPHAASYRYLAGYRGRSWWGIEAGDAEYKIWGSGIKTARTRGEYFKKVLGRVKDWTVGVTVVSPFFQSDDDLKRAAELLFRTRPRFVFGYANSIHLLASYMVKNGLEAGPGWPRAVGYTAEMLLEWQREEATRAFGAPLIAEYGSCEAGVIAYQCPEGSLHTSDDINVVEILDGDEVVENGRVGEVVVTSLMALDYPLVRYRQGDMASLGTERCPCGRGLGTMSALVGRLNDYFRSPSGGVIDFIVFDQAMKDQPAIRRFKVIERGTGDLVFLAELHQGREWPRDDQDLFLRQCLALLPSDVKLSIASVDRLPAEPSGKFRIMIPAADADTYLGDRPIELLQRDASPLPRSR